MVCQGQIQVNNPSSDHLTEGRGRHRGEAEEEKGGGEKKRGWCEREGRERDREWGDRGRGRGGGNNKLDHFIEHATT